MGSTNQDYEAIQKAFLGALDCAAPEERAAFLDKACARDPAMREPLEALLNEYEADGGSAAMQSGSRDAAAPCTHPREPFGDFGDYEILEEVGHGGMGVVYKARQRSVNRIVALKMIRSGHWASDADVSRFRIEAEAAARLEHPNIAAVFEAGECEDQLYYSMAFFGGADLQDRFTPEKPCPPREAARLVKRIAAAVHHAHQRGVLHRDLKPANILLDDNDEPHVTDFGLARLTDADTSLTRSNIMLGSPSYMAPELAAGAAGRASALSDVYGLGAILYFLLAAKPPFQAQSTLETLHKVADEEPSAPRLGNPRVPRDLDTICLRCLQKDPAKRYPSADDVAKELGRFLNGEPILARPAGMMERGWRWCVRKPALASALAGMFLTFLTGTIGVLWLWRQSIAEEQRARRDAYTSNMLLAHQKYHVAHMKPFKQMLLDALPEPGQEDLRGFEWYYLYSLCHRDPRTITSSLMHVEEALPSPDGTILAVRGHRGYWPSNTRDVDSVIEFWDTESGDRLAPIEGDAATGFVCFAFSPNGRFLAAANLNNEVEIWDVATRSREHALPGHSDWVHSVAYSPDGTMLASGGFDQSIRIWDMTKDPPTSVHNIYAETRRVLDVVFSPDGKALAGTGDDGFIQLSDPLSGRALHRLGKPTKDFVMVADFHPDAAEHLLATGGGNGRITLWNSATGEPLGNLEGHTADVYGLEFSPDGRRLVSGSWDRTVRLWDSMSGVQIGSFFAHENYVRSAHFLPDGRRIVSASYEGIIKLWNTAKATIARTIRPPMPDSGKSRVVGRLAFSRDGSRLLSIGGPAKVWDIASGECLFFTEEDGYRVQDEISRDFRQLPAGVRDGRLRILDVDGRHDDLTNRTRTDPSRYAWSPDGRSVAYSAPGEGIRIFDAATGKRVRTCAPHRAPVTGLHFSPGGDRLAASAEDGVLVIWDAETGKQKNAFGIAKNFALSSPISGSVFSPDGRRIWTKSRRDERCTLWDLESRLSVLEGYLYMIFSPDGRQIATSLPGKEGVCIYDSRSLERRCVLESDDGGGIVSIAFSPDSRRIASGSHRLVQLWDSQTGRELLTLDDFDADVNSVAFSPDGRSLATGSYDGSIYLWVLPSQEKIEEWLKADLAKRNASSGQ